MKLLKFFTAIEPFSYEHILPNYRGSWSLLDSAFGEGGGSRVYKVLCLTTFLCCHGNLSIENFSPTMLRENVLEFA